FVPDSLPSLNPVLPCHKHRASLPRHRTGPSRLPGLSAVWCVPALPLSPQCISVPDVFTLVGKAGTGDANLTATELPQLGAGVLLYLTDPAATCAAVRGGQWVAEAGYLGEGPKAPSPGVRGLRETRSANAQQLPALRAHVVQKSTAVSGRVAADVAGRVLVTVTYHVLLGDCFHALPPPHYFLGYIFRRYGNESQNLTLAGEPLSWLRALGRGGLRSVAWVPPTPSVTPHLCFQMCLSPGDLLEIYSLDPDAGISGPDFTSLSPALLQQQLSGACSVPHLRYIYGSLATLVICLCALLGIVLLLCTACASAYPYVIQGFVSLAVGSLTGDLLAVLGGIYVFFLLEKFFSVLGSNEPEVWGRGRQGADVGGRWGILEGWGAQKKAGALPWQSALTPMPQ
uniref:Solute carrier family 39 member 4 n=1 Tax=Chrysemys picta bellii TaxID=8478 RepID=A0A8C3I0Y3_CHRPI